MGLYDKNDKDESSKKNTYNANINYKHLLKNKHRLRDGITLKINNGVYEKLYNPNDDVSELVWKVTEAIYATFSWNDLNNYKCGVPLSFHIDISKFEKSLNRLLNPVQAKEEYDSYYY